MLKKIFVRKIGMTQVLDNDGVAHPCTILKFEPCQIVQIKTSAKEGYNALQIGTSVIKKEKLINKPMKGHFKNISNVYKFLGEVKVSDQVLKDVNVGDFLSLESFIKGEKVNVSGKSIGKGFQGTIKRWNFGRGPMSHGSKSHRLPGSIGGHTEPGHVFKGKKMAGRMGGVMVTTKNLKIIEVNDNEEYILVKGSVPGASMSMLELTAKGDLKFIKLDDFNKKETDLGVESSLEITDSKESDSLEKEVLDNINLGDNKEEVKEQKEEIIEENQENK